MKKVLFIGNDSYASVAITSVLFHRPDIALRNYSIDMVKTISFYRDDTVDVGILVTEDTDETIEIVDMLRAMSSFLILVGNVKPLFPPIEHFLPIHNFPDYISAAGLAEKIYLFLNPLKIRIPKLTAIQKETLFAHCRLLTVNEACAKLQISRSAYKGRISKLMKLFGVSTPLKLRKHVINNNILPEYCDIFSPYENRILPPQHLKLDLLKQQIYSDIIDFPEQD